MDDNQLYSHYDNNNFDNVSSGQCQSDYQLHQLNQLNPSYHNVSHYVISEFDSTKLVDQQQRVAQKNEPPTTMSHRSSSSSSSYRNNNKNHEKSIFPQKLWRLVNNQQMTSAIRWSDDGQSFFVYENSLKHMCLGKENNVFYTKQPKSFVRQLHLYGFRKINKNQFMHHFFVRGRPELLKSIKRSYKQSSASTSSPEKYMKYNSRNTKKFEDITKSGLKPGVSVNILPINNSHDSKVNNQLNTNVIGGCGSTNSSSSIATNSSITTATTTAVTSTTTLNGGPSTLDDGQAEAQRQFDVSQNTRLQQELDGNQFGCNSEDVFNSEAALTLRNNCNDYDFYPSQTDWYENNYSDNIYYNDDSILKLYHNDIYPNTYDDNNITF